MPDETPPMLRVTGDIDGDYSPHLLELGQEVMRLVWTESFPEGRDKEIHLRLQPEIEMTAVGRVTGQYSAKEGREMIQVAMETLRRQNRHVDDEELLRRFLQLLGHEMRHAGQNEEKLLAAFSPGGSEFALQQYKNDPMEADADQHGAALAAAALQDVPPRPMRETLPPDSLVESYRARVGESFHALVERARPHLPAPLVEKVAFQAAPQDSLSWTLLQTKRSVGALPPQIIEHLGRRGLGLDLVRASGSLKGYYEFLTRIATWEVEQELSRRTSAPSQASAQEKEQLWDSLERYVQEMEEALVAERKRQGVAGSPQKERYDYHAWRNAAQDALLVSLWDRPQVSESLRSVFDESAPRERQKTGEMFDDYAISARNRSTKKRLLDDPAAHQAIVKARLWERWSLEAREQEIASEMKGVDLEQGSWLLFRKLADNFEGLDSERNMEAFWATHRTVLAPGLFPSPRIPSMDERRGRAL